MQLVELGQRLERRERLDLQRFQSLDSQLR
jgi:hypothetical protein